MLAVREVEVAGVGRQALAVDVGVFAVAVAVREALRLTVLTSAATVVVCLVVGTPLAWVLARVPFPGRAVPRRYRDAVTSVRASASRSTPTAGLRRASEVVLVAGTVIAVAAAFGPLWATRVGVAVAVAAAVVACVCAWRELFNAYTPPRMAVAEAWVPASRRPRYASADGLGQAFNFDLLQAPWNADAFTRIVRHNLDLAAASGSSAMSVPGRARSIRNARRARSWRKSRTAPSPDQWASASGSWSLSQWRSGTTLRTASAPAGAANECSASTVLPSQSARWQSTAGWPASSTEARPQPSSGHSRRRRTSRSIQFSSEPGSRRCAATLTRSGPQPSAATTVSGR